MAKVKPRVKVPKTAEVDEVIEIKTLISHPMHSGRAVDGDGNRIFKTGDVDALGKKAGVVLDRLFDAARKASGIGDSDMQELAKN